MTGVRARVTPISFFILLLHCWGDTKPQLLITDSVSDTEFPSLSQSHTRSMAETLDAADSLNDFWINQILNTLENLTGKTEGSQANVSQGEDISELYKDFPQPTDLDKAYEDHMPLPENSKDNESNIVSILQTLQNKPDFQRVAPSDSVLKKIVTICMIVTSSLSALSLILCIFSSLLMKSHPREPPVNNTCNIYVTKEMKKNPDAIKEIFSVRTKEDNDSLSSDTPNLQNEQSPRNSIKESDSKGKLFIQNSNYNNRTILPGDFMKGHIMPLKGFIVPSYGSKDFVLSSELSDSDAFQILSLPDRLSDIPHLLLKREYMEKKGPNKVSGSHKEPESSSHSQHKLNSPDRKHQNNASPDSLKYAQETQSDTYPSSNSTENPELVDNPQRNKSAIVGSSISSSWSSHSD